MKQVPWQLTDQTCELLDGIRCADSLAMFLGQDATAVTMKGLKVSSTAMDTESIARAFMVDPRARFFVMKNTKSLRKL